jgi:glycerol-3-phosphate acyltransferase PlsX
MNKIIISVDAMGGANAPHCVVDAIDKILQTHKDVYFKIFGDEDRVKKAFKSYGEISDRIEIIHTTKAVTDDEQPIKALKQGRESSMYKAIQSVKAGESQACISGGNTGALMVMSKMVLGSLPNVKRPAIVNVFPNLKGGCVILDLGANSECDPINLFQFALMGHCYARAVLKKTKPLIGILNVGTEEYKGRDIEKKTYELLKQSGLNFYGHIEGYDITNGTVDVVVTDGFSGNIVIKVAEGTAKMCRNYIKEAFQSSFFAKLGGLLAKKGLKTILGRVDPRNYNGAMFVGVDGIVVKSHGSSDAKGFANALEVTISLIKQDINNEISQLLTQLHELESTKESLISKIKHKLGFE